LRWYWGRRSGHIAGKRNKLREKRVVREERGRKSVNSVMRNTTDEALEMKVLIVISKWMDSTH